MQIKFINSSTAIFTHEGSDYQISYQFSKGTCTCPDLMSVVIKRVLHDKGLFKPKFKTVYRMYLPERGNKSMKDLFINHINFYFSEWVEGEDLDKLKAPEYFAIAVVLILIGAAIIGGVFK